MAFERQKTVFGKRVHILWKHYKTDIPKSPPGKALSILNLQEHDILFCAMHVCESLDFVEGIGDAKPDPMMAYITKRSDKGEHPAKP